MDNDHWGKLIIQSEAHLLAPRLHRMVKETSLALGLSAPDAFALTPAQVDRLEQNQILSHRAHALAEVYINKLLSEFKKQGVPVICLKGWAFAQRFYRIPTDRSFLDIDLLFKKSDRLLVREVLERQGYQRTSGDHHWDPVSEKEEYHALGHVSPPVECHYGLGYGKFRFGEDIWERSQIFPAPGGVDIRVLSPEDEYLYLTYHLGVQHRFQKLGWLLDLIQMRKRGFYPRSVPDSLRPALKYTEKLFADCRSQTPSKIFCQIALGEIERSPVKRLQMRARLQGGVGPLIRYLWGRILFNASLRKSGKKDRQKNSRKVTQNSAQRSDDLFYRGIGAQPTEDMFSTLLSLPADQMQEFVFVANGKSMVPTIMLGDRLHSRRVSEAPSLGDIVVCQGVDKKWRVHRVVKVKPKLVTQGDFLSFADPDPLVIAAVVFRIERTWMSHLRRLKHFLFGTNKDA